MLSQCSHKNTEKYSLQFNLRIPINEMILFSQIPAKGFQDKRLNTYLGVRRKELVSDVRHGPSADKILSAMLLKRSGFERQGT